MNVAPPVPRRSLPHLLTFALAAFTGMSAAAADMQVAGKTVELPDFTVTDSRVLPEAPPWHYGRVGRFEVLSSTTAGRTRKLLADFQKFQQALTLLWPAQPRPLASATLVLCAREGEFASLLPPGANAKQDAPPSRLLRDADSLAIAVNLAADRLLIDDASALAANGATSVELDIDHAQLLYREYVFSLLNQSASRPPPWMAEGLVQIVMDAEVTDRWLNYGKIDTFKGGATGGEAVGSDETDPSAGGAAVVGEQPFNVVLRHRKLMPLAQFFALTADAPEARSPLGNNLWAKQAYLFVHFCLFGEDLRYRDAIVQFVGRLAREPLSEALFRDCFKIGFAQMEEELRAYIRHVRHKYQSYDIKPEDRLNPTDIVLADASPAQIGVILGDAQRLAGNLDRAAATYREAYQRGSRAPALLAGLALTEAHAGQSTRAAKFLEAACAAHVERPSAHAALARARLTAALAHPAADGKLDAAQMATALAPVFEARQHPPLIAETYHVAADAWAASAAAPKIANLAVLDEGLKAFPRDSALVLKGAHLYAAIGANDIAASIARMGARFATDADARERFAQLLATLPPATK
ncbi:MAG: hypothetical protein KF715_01360 [Candidatus Didemnitutus sp.]|nr:hypothetical protein [Candidatus Didemnitutus sp.]